MQDLLANKAVENVRLEFKREVPEKDDLLKKLSSFANMYGGCLVVGAEANSKDGRLQGLPGVEPQAGYKQTVVQWVYDGAAPPFEVEVSDSIPILGGENRVCYVIRVEASDLSPHFLNGRKGVYVRTNEFSGRYEPALANERELRILADRRRVVGERRAAVIARSSARFETFLKNGKGPFGPTMEISIGPQYPSRELIHDSELRQILSSIAVAGRGVSFPSAIGQRISQYESVIITNAKQLASFLELNSWGLLYYATQIASPLHVSKVVGTILNCLTHARLVFETVGYAGTLILDFSLSRIHQAPLILRRETTPRPDDSKAGSPFDEALRFDFFLRTEELDNDVAHRRILEKLVFGLDLAFSDYQPDDLLAMGRRYNDSV